ncbi:hypothetical protein [Thalassomonas actiniarum]|uniref:Uncharacterized protein n=1 Tax=Thalassomonas actiniarum TaxID=485447 RepID=A0AAE9YY24_9GAMM|nr:hypothetical protein [Thalassomonas actiniarum]WDE02464.1 hypothetical protein SG35_029075 [Thalassomonas actiniarum]
MSIIENVLIALGLSPAKELTDSMRESKTLTIMVVVGLILFGGFALFLLHMAGKQ